MAQGLKKPIADIKNFIKKLQRSDDKTKKRWLVVSSAISMVIIFFLWLAYLNAVVMPETKQEKATATTIKISEGGQKKSFFRTFSIGLKTVTGDLKKQFLNIKEDFNQTYDNFKNRIQKKNEFILEKSDIMQNNQNQ